METSLIHFTYEGYNKDLNRLLYDFGTVFDHLSPYLKEYWSPDYDNGDISPLMLLMSGISKVSKYLWLTESNIYGISLTLLHVIMKYYYSITFRDIYELSEKMGLSKYDLFLMGFDTRHTFGIERDLIIKSEIALLKTLDYCIDFV